SSVWSDEPAVTGVERPHEWDAQESAFDGKLSLLARLPALPVRGLLLRRLRVMRSACVMDPQVRKHGSAKPDPLEIRDVGGILKPEDVLLVLPKTANSLVELSRRNRAPPAGWTAEKPNAVLLHQRVFMRPDVMSIARCQVVWIILEIGSQEADAGKALEGLEQSLVPFR